MAKKPTRLRFTEDDLADSKVKKAADRADKAADKAEKAVDKLASKKKATKLRQETDAAGSRKAKLRFGKADNSVAVDRPSSAKQLATRGTAVTLTSKVHRAVSEYEDDNVGIQSAQETTKAVESTAYTVDHAIYSHKLKAHDKADKLVQKSDKANVDALYEKFKKDNPDAGSNPFSRWRQKQAIKKEYAAAKAGNSTAKTTAAKGAEKAAQGAKTIAERVTEFCTTHSKVILLVLVAGLLFMVISSMFSSCAALFQGGTQVILGTSFTAEDEDIIGADNDYKALEAALRNQINNIERTHSGYDEYRYDLDEINHNPYEYMDQVGDMQAHIQEIKADLAAGNTAPYREFLNTAIAESREETAVEVAKVLRSQLDKLSPPKREQLKEMSVFDTPHKPPRSHPERDLE